MFYQKISSLALFTAFRIYYFMLKIMRSHKFFTVFLLGIITVVITIAFVFYGIGPQQNSSDTIIARINKQRITLAEYDRAYTYAYRRARETYKNEDEIKKLNLQQKVLQELIDNTVLIGAAHKAGITVTDKELKDSIINEPAFQTNGVFSKEVYERRLKLNRITPALFESSMKNDLLLNKIRRLIGETAELTAQETQILTSMKENKAQLSEIFLFSRKELSIKAYIEALKRQMTITVNKDFIF
jgi:peptidyl-prolyl cis-trans isomerase D